MRKHPPNTKANLAEVLEQGGWFCVACDQFVEPGETIGDAFSACPRCGRAGALRWVPPALGNQTIN